MQVSAPQAAEPCTQLPSCDLLIGKFASVDAQSLMMLNQTSLLLSPELESSRGLAGECWDRQPEGNV